MDIHHYSKENFKKYIKNIQQYDTVILDEAHVFAGVTPTIRYRNKQPIPKASQIFDLMVWYLENFPPNRLYLLTATPTRSPMAVWGLAKILGINWDFYKFREAFYIVVRKGYREFWLPKQDLATKERLGRAVRLLGYTGQLSDYFDVPEQTYKEIKLDLTREQKEKLEQIKTIFPDPLVQIGKRHQIENGVLSGDEFTDAEEIDDNKIKILKDLAMEFPKMVIFAKYTAQIAKIEEELGAEGYNVVTLEGKTKNRAEVLKQAEQSKECIIIIQAQISAGFELPSFPVMVFASMSYSVVDYVQACGRIQRASHIKKNLYVSLITKGGIDEAVFKSIQNKKDFAAKIYLENETKLNR